MSYFSTPYKYGRKTKVQILSIPTTILSIGDNVFNTDINKEEYWTGTNWINDDCIEAFNSSGVILSEGQVVNINNGVLGATSAEVELSDSVTDNWQIGVIYRGGINGAKVIVACMGLYKVKFTAATTSTTRQQIAQLTTTAGEANSTAAKTGGAGSIGVIAETYAVVPVDKLVNCWINSAEAF